MHTRVQGPAKLCFLCRDVNTMMRWAQSKAAALPCPRPQDSKGPVCPPRALGNLAGLPTGSISTKTSELQTFEEFLNYENNRGPCAWLCGCELVLRQATTRLQVRGGQQEQEWRQSVQLQNGITGQDPVDPVFASRHSLFSTT